MNSDQTPVILAFIQKCSIGSFYLNSDNLCPSSSPEWKAPMIRPPPTSPALPPTTYCMSFTSVLGKVDFLALLQSRAHSISLPWLMLFPPPGGFCWHFWLCSLHFKTLTYLSKLCDSSFFMKFLSTWRWRFPSLELSDTFLPWWGVSCCTVYCDDLWSHRTLSNKPQVQGQGLFSANLSLSPSD